MEIKPQGGEIVSENEQSSLWKTTWGTLKRGLVGSAAAVLFGGVILMASIFAAANPLHVKQYEGFIARDVPTPLVEMERTTERVATAPAKVEYYLPYPGMLPDSPLYRLKSVRDRIKLWLTSNPVKKAELQLLYADKRINASVFLMDGGKQELAVSTATKAEKYLEQAVNEASLEVKAGRDVKSLLLTMQNATQKHYEILELLQTKSDSQWQEVLSKTKETTKTLQQRVAQALMESK